MGSSTIIAYFFVALLNGYPVLYGPYGDRSSCMDVEEWVSRRGYETETCTMMSVPQESTVLQVGYLP